MFVVFEVLVAFVVVALGIAVIAYLAHSNRMLQHRLADQQAAAHEAAFAMKASETLLRSTLESIDEGVLLVSDVVKVLSVNRRFMELWHVTAAEALVTRLLAAAAQPVMVGVQSLQVSASLGVTFYPQPDDVDADLMLRQADQAMYQAKLAGKNRYHVFDAAQDRSVRGHHESLESIRLGLANDDSSCITSPS